MSKDVALEKSYANPLIGYGYEALSLLVYAPIGGRDAMREAALDLIGLRSGERVLELGCGTGGLTRKLLARGAEVTSVDWSEPMLRVARRAAPLARFERSEITAYTPSSEFDLVLLAFVLHELPVDARQIALGIARRALCPGGRVAVVDHAEPSEGLVPRTVFRFVHAFEPPSIAEWARSTFEPELEQAGLHPIRSASLARGTARAVIAAARG